MNGVQIAGIGTALPGTDVAGRVVTNTQLAQELLARRDVCVREGTILPPDQWPTNPEERAVAERHWLQFESDNEWIVSHTGIHERRVAAPEVATSDLAAAAGLKALRMAGWTAPNVEFVIVATVSPDHPATPPTVALVQEKMGIPSEAQGRLNELEGVDVSCACSSFGKALKIGWAYIASGLYQRGLVIGADVMTRLANVNDRSMIPIFGDAGGALALQQTAPEHDAFFGPRSFYSGLDGSRASMITTPEGGSRTPLSRQTDLSRPYDQSYKMVMQGNPLFKAVQRLLVPRDFAEQAAWRNHVITAALAKLSFGLSDVDLFALHQANQRINGLIEGKLRAAGFAGCVYHNIARYGNTTSASIPLILDDARKDLTLQRGHQVMVVVFGGGLSWECVTARWTLA